MLSLAGTDVTSEMVGIPLAILLLLLATLLLPPGQRRRARQGAVLLGLSLVCGAARFVFPPDASVRRPLLFAATFFLLASMGRSLVLLLVDVLLERRTARPAPKIFRDVSTGIAYLVVALVALHAVGVEPGSLLTTSALLTAVVGLSLQDTLGNLVSGLALQMQRPFDVGDWIEVDQAHSGQVTEVTWRATSIMTLDHVEVILPNASLAKAAIRNYSRPSRVSRRRLAIGVTYDASPSDVHAVLGAAAADTPGVLPEPRARARTKAFGDSAIVYEVLYFVDDFAHAFDVDGAVADRVYHALARRGISIPYPTRTMLAPLPEPPENRRDVERGRIASVLGSLELMQPLPPDSRAVLVERAAVRRYGPGELVVRKGEASLEMFVVEAGALAVEVPREGGGAAEVAALRPGDCFGEMGLLTGEARSASVRAKTLCDLVVIDHDAFHDVLAGHPEVVERMGGLLAARQAGLDAAAASAERAAPPEERKQRLISQIRSFFKLV
ncbi:MAG TPA: mechanosensitive ion channel family protein [Polyangiaceae bacterium]|nr:mechanosensitive ion channel family protein [Polyangiaceae bacterium]